MSLAVLFDASGLPLEEIARRTGLSAGYVRAIRSGSKRASYSAALRLARTLRVPLDRFLLIPSKETHSRESEHPMLSSAVSKRQGTPRANYFFTAPRSAPDGTPGRG